MMVEQILYMSRGEYQRVFDSPPQNPFNQYIAHSPPKWQGPAPTGPNCVTLCRATQETLDSVDAEQLGNYTIGLVPGGQDTIDTCYDTTPVEIFDENGDPYNPPQFYTPPIEIGAFA